MKKGQKCRHLFLPYKKKDTYDILKCKHCGKTIKDYETSKNVRDKRFQ